MPYAGTQAQSGLGTTIAIQTSTLGGTATITAATNATPIVVTATNTFVNGDTVTITGVVGNTGANGTFVISAVSGSGFTLVGSVGTGVWTSGGTVTRVTPVFTTIGEIRKATQSNYQNESDDATNFASSAREFIPTILNPGTWDMEINRVSSDAGQTALVASLNGLTLKKYLITLPKTATQTTTGDTKTFTAMVEKYGAELMPDKIIKISASLKVSNAITETAGS